VRTKTVINPDEEVTSKPLLVASSFFSVIVRLCSEPECCGERQRGGGFVIAFAAGIPQVLLVTQWHRSFGLICFTVLIVASKIWLFGISRAIGRNTTAPCGAMFDYKALREISANHKEARSLILVANPHRSHPPLA